MISFNFVDELIQLQEVILDQLLHLIDFHTDLVLVLSYHVRAQQQCLCPQQLHIVYFVLFYDDVSLLVHLCYFVLVDSDA